jgi:DNA-binding transcriptional LysR family regulator
MLDLRRLRLLRELSERGTIAAVADALQFTPSAVSQQLAILEREAGVALLERSGRGVRLTDAALMLVEHAQALLERAAVAEADLAAAAETVTGRARIAAIQSVSLRLAIPAIRTLARDAPRLRCELVEAEPEQALPALALGDVDIVLADEWQHQPWPMPSGLTRHELLRDPVFVVLPAKHSARPRGEISLRELSKEVWVTGHPGMGWDEVTRRTCRALGGFEPDIRHRTDDATIALALVEEGLALTLLPGLALAAIGQERDVVQRPIAEGEVWRSIFAVTRTADAARPSTQALIAAVQAAATNLRDAAP